MENLSVTDEIEILNFRSGENLHFLRFPVNFGSSYTNEMPEKRKSLVENRRIPVLKAMVGSFWGKHPDLLRIFPI